MSILSNVRDDIGHFFNDFGTWLHANMPRIEKGLEAGLSQFMSAFFATALTSVAQAAADNSFPTGETKKAYVVGVLEAAAINAGWTVAKSTLGLLNEAALAHYKMQNGTAIAVPPSAPPAP